MGGFAVRIDEDALREIRELKERVPSMAQKFARLVDLIEKLGPRAPHVKKITGTKNGWRLHFGRYRALFSCEGNFIIIWIIFMEKDTKKDYQRWVPYLLSTGKFR